jgi:hypothetical protein
MKINQIVQETTTSGSVAPVEHGFVKMQSRNPSVYGSTKAGSLFKGKKTKAPYANSINESAMKQLSMDLKGGADGLSDQEFQKKYKMTKQEARKELTSNRKENNKPQPVSEAHLEEDDIILVPGQGRKMKTGFVPHGQSRVDHEVEMARSDLFSAAQNAQKVYSMIKHMSEEEGLEGWVQEKIIKANDYLNTIREYLEGKQVQGVAEGSLNEFAPDGFNGGDDGEEFSPEMAKMAQEDGFTKGASLADGATLERAMAINDWDKHDGGIYRQHFAKGFKAGRLDKIRHNNKQYNLNLKLMKDGSIRHGEQGVAEGTKVDRMVKHITKSEKKLGKSKDEAENIAWATANKRGMLDNKNKKA